MSFIFSVQGRVRERQLALVTSMLRMARKGISVGLVSAEMKDVRIMLRLLSDQTNINSRSLRNGTSFRAQYTAGLYRR